MLPKLLDVGAANVLRDKEGYECYGIDITNPRNDPRIKTADLAFDKLPYEDNTFDLITATDVLEHIPQMIWFWNGTKMERRLCLIELFNEFYRIMTHGAILHIESPCFPHKAVWQDPTHASVWSDELINYFSGDYFGHKFYGHTSRFEKIDVHFRGAHVIADLRAIKNLPDDHPFLLQY